MGQNGAWKANVHSLCPSAPGYSSHGERRKMGCLGRRLWLPKWESIGAEFRDLAAKVVRRKSAHQGSYFAPTDAWHDWKRFYSSSRVTRVPLLKAQRMPSRAGWVTLLMEIRKVNWGWRDSVSPRLKVRDIIRQPFITDTRHTGTIRQGHSINI